MNRELVFSLFTSRRMDSNSWRSVARSRTDASVLGGRGTKACELDGDCAGVMKCGITRVVGKSSWCKFNGNQQRDNGSSAACTNEWRRSWLADHSHGERKLRHVRWQTKHSRKMCAKYFCPTDPQFDQSSLSSRSASLPCDLSFHITPGVLGYYWSSY